VHGCRVPAVGAQCRQSWAGRGRTARSRNRTQVTPTPSATRFACSGQLEPNETPDPLRSSAVDPGFHDVLQLADRHDQHKLTGEYGAGGADVTGLNSALVRRPAGGIRLNGDSGIFSLRDHREHATLLLAISDLILAISSRSARGDSGSRQGTGAGVALAGVMAVITERRAHQRQRQAHQAGERHQPGERHGGFPPQRAGSRPAGGPRSWWRGWP
jgi:hypothetical protein